MEGGSCLVLGGNFFKVVSSMMDLIKVLAAKWVNKTRNRLWVRSKTSTMIATTDTRIMDLYRAKALKFFFPCRYWIHIFKVFKKGIKPAIIRKAIPSWELSL